jgi:hypothetical protein
MKVESKIKSDGLLVTVTFVKGERASEGAAWDAADKIAKSKGYGVFEGQYRDQDGQGNDVIKHFYKKIEDMYKKRKMSASDNAKFDVHSTDPARLTTSDHDKVLAKMEKKLARGASKVIASIEDLFDAYERNKMEPGVIIKYAKEIKSELKDMYGSEEDKQKAKMLIERLLKNLGA